MQAMEIAGFVIGGLGALVCIIRGVQCLTSGQDGSAIAWFVAVPVVFLVGAYLAMLLIGAVIVVGVLWLAAIAISGG
jgi:hypothetical protein